MVYVLGVALGGLARGGGEQKGPSTLDVWMVHEEKKHFAAMVANFEKNTGTRVEIKVFDNMQKYEKTLLTELAAGRGPDVAMVHPGWLESYEQVLQPLPKEFSLDAEDIAELFVETVQHDAVRGEDIFGLPVSVDTLALLYVRPLFRDVLAKPNARPGVSWGEIAAESSRLKERNDDGSLKRGGLSVGRTDTITRGSDAWRAVFLQLGGNAFAEKGRSALGKAAAEATDIVTRFFT